MGLLGDEKRPSLKKGVWDDSFLRLPSLPASAYENVFTGEVVNPVRHQEADALSLADLFRTFPVALLRGVDRKVPGDG